MIGVLESKVTESLELLKEGQVLGKFHPGEVDAG